GNEMFGYFESDDLEAAKAYLGAQDVSARWQDAMAELLEQRVPDEGPPALEEVFRLEGWTTASSPPPSRGSQPSAPRTAPTSRRSALWSTATSSIRPSTASPSARRT